MNNLIVQADIPGKMKENKMHGYFEQLYEDSKKEFMQYAKNTGADYLCIHAPKYKLHATYERFQIFEERFDGYDMILYADSDMIPVRNAPDIFKEYQDAAFAAFSEGSVFYGNNSELQKEFGLHSRMENIISRRMDKGYLQEEQKYLSNEWLENRYFNGGVFLIHKSARMTARSNGLEHCFKPYALYDLSAMNRLIYENKIPFTHLSYKYNGLFHFYSNELKAKVIKRSYFIHFCGPMKNLYAVLEQEFGHGWQNQDIPEHEICALLDKHAEII